MWTPCLTSGKRRYPTRTTAREVLAEPQADRSGRRKKARRVYFCRACHGWHVTTQRKAA